MTDFCLFCKIVSGEIPGTIVFRDEQVTAFRDINPVAPTHILIVPNEHITSVGALTSEDEQLMGSLNCLKFLRARLAATTHDESYWDHFPDTSVAGDPTSK